MCTRYHNNIIYYSFYTHYYIISLPRIYYYNMGHNVILSYSCSVLILRLHSTKPFLRFRSPTTVVGAGWRLIKLCSTYKVLYRIVVPAVRFVSKQYLFYIALRIHIIKSSYIMQIGGTQKKNTREISRYEQYLIAFIYLLLWSFLF